MTIATVAENRAFDGVQGVYRHDSVTTRGPMRFGVYMPPQSRDRQVPAVYWLSGLTCTEENFITKAGAQRVASSLGLALVVPDTSPRVAIAGDRDHWDFGVGASFYVEATREPWSRHYRMDSYVSTELPEVVAGRFNVDPHRMSILGHSMGGHGALVLALRNPDRYRAVSAFAPIASPMRCTWGEKALSGYLGDDRAAWRAYDATALIEDRGWSGPPLLVDQGLNDPFIETQLKPGLLEEACRKAGVPLNLRRHAGYDHSYFFIATFIDEHLRYHAAHLFDAPS
jgi:S-formylglutathione hydrolase